MLGMANVKDAERWANWKRQGDALFAEREGRSAAGAGVSVPANAADSDI